MFHFIGLGVCATKIKLGLKGQVLCLPCLLTKTDSVSLWLLFSWYTCSVAQCICGVCKVLVMDIKMKEQRTFAKNSAFHSLNPDSL